MNSQIRKILWSSAVLMTALLIGLVGLRMETGAAQASGLQQDATKPMTDTLPAAAVSHLERMMARLEAMEARLTAMEKRMGGPVDQNGGQNGMMGGGPMRQGGMMGQDGMMGGDMMKRCMMMEGGMMGNRAEMHARMAEMHASMAMMASMTEMHRMMGQGGMMEQRGGPPDEMPRSGAGPAVGDPTAPDSAQTAMLGDIEVKLTPMNLADLSGDTITFTVDLNSPSGGLTFDLVKLAFIEAGMDVEAASWQVAFDHGHHVNGTLTFSLTHGGGHRYLDGAKTVTVAIHAPKGDEKVSFTWPLP